MFTVYKNGPMHSLILNFHQTEQVIIEVSVDFIFAIKMNIIINKEILYK